MPQSITHAWHELSQGNYAQAERIFQQYINEGNDAAEALRGMGRVALHRGDVKRAEALARQSMSLDANGDVQLLIGEILGAQGKRREAERFLSNAVEYNTSDAYARALLAEQIIRQGRWEEGTNQFIRALSDDDDGDGFRCLQGVLCDLVDAFHAGRIPETEAMKFVNRLDYSVPKTGPEMQAFFGEARRSIASGTPLQRRNHPPHTTLPQSVRRAAQHAGSGASTPVASAAAPPVHARRPRRRRADRRRPRRAGRRRPRRPPNSPNPSSAPCPSPRRRCRPTRPPWSTPSATTYRRSSSASASSTDNCWPTSPR